MWLDKCGHNVFGIILAKFLEIYIRFINKMHACHMSCMLSTKLENKQVREAIILLTLHFIHLFAKLSYVLLMEALQVKDVLRCTTITNGGQFVMVDGT